jgi:hypothetical protein
VGAACRHIQKQNDKVDMTPVWTALKNAPTETRLALLPVCSGFAVPEAREILRAGVADSDPRIRAAAVHAMCDATDAELLTDVEKIACQPSDPEFRILAIQACVRLTTQEESITIPDAERLKLFQAIAPAAASPAEKRVVLSGLATMPSNGALQLAEPLLADAAVNNEAARAVIGICSTLPDAEAAQAGLEKVISQTNDQNRQDAETALTLVRGRADYLTTWEVSGPYRKAGQNYTQLFDIVFPPETANAQGVNWRVLPPSDNPKSPWVMDLLKAIGGNQEVAYARTSVHSAVEQTAWLNINSDDGVKVWLNGAVVHANNVTRALNGPTDKVKITLKPGWNELLLKVTQNNLGWGFYVRLTNPDGTRLKGLQCATGPVHSSM